MNGFGKGPAWRAIETSLGVLAAVWFAGCGGQTLCPVYGRIVYTDGASAKELEGYTVTFESVDQAATELKPGVSATGVVQADGTFQLGTYKPGDGVVPGRHRVAICAPLSLADGALPPSLIPLKYANFAASGLEVDIKPGPNEVTLTVERNPAGKVPGGKK